MEEMTGKRFFAALREMLGTEEPLVEELCKGGSSRRFFRVSGPAMTAPSLILSITGDMEEFRYYVALQRHFELNGVPVPRFYGVFPEEGAVIMSDAGRVSLFDAALGCSGSDRIRLYLKVMGELIRFQSIGVEGCPELLERPFGLDSLLWESSYFAEFFLGQRLGIRSLPEGVPECFDRVARTLAALPMRPMHRDFQSQNVFLPEGEPCFIDFQGARMGNVFYDAASLVYDPYVPLSRDERDELASAFLENLEGCCGKDARGLLNLAAVSRLMQALGAYANLSMNRGKPSFAVHMGPGLENLRGVLEMTEGLDALKGLVEKIELPKNI